MKEKPNKKFLFLVDDGWRQEKKEILLFLRSYIHFEVVTHDEMTYRELRDELPVRLIERIPLKRGLVHSVVMFFARELHTNLVQYRKRIKYYTYSFPMRLLHRLRDVLGHLRLRVYSYTVAREWLYRNSNAYADVLEGFDALVYMPVAVSDKRLIFEARRRGLQIINWIYSWDNPMKDNEFLADADLYLVWNEQVRADVVELHGVPAERIRLVGPVQFDYLFAMDIAAIPPATTPYVLYACATGLDFHLEQENNVILEIRKLLDEIRPGIKLAVRPYPFRLNMDGYTPLRGVEGIDLLDFGRVEENRVLLSEDDVRGRIIQIQQAECFVNMGSTIGLEAAFTDTPILQFNFNYPCRVPAYQSLAKVLKNEHLKYLILPEYPNTVNSPAELKQRLREVLEGERAKFKPYAQRLQAFANPMGRTCYKEVLGEVLASS